MAKDAAYHLERVSISFLITENYCMV